jgi:hypothetical protein
MGKPKAKTRAIWEERIARWEQSKLSAEEFAPLEGVRPSSLKWWRWRLSGEARRATAAAKGEPTKAAFIEVGPATPVPEVPAQFCGSFEVVLRNGRVVRVPTGFSDGELARVLAVAEGASR